MNTTTAKIVDSSAAIRTAPKDLYRLLVLRGSSSELLVTGQRPPFSLPCFEIPRWERVAERLTAAILKRYGISAICLFCPQTPMTTTGSDQPFYQVMETREVRTEAADEIRWLPLATMSNDALADEKDLVAITNSLRQMTESERAESGGPFCKSGWIEELFSWVQHQIDPYGLRLTGELRQVNASPTSALLRLETNGPSVWFKAVGKANRRERGITLVLSSLFPGYVPTVIATHLPWNGWLATEFPGSTLDEVPDSHPWVRSAQTLAELQLASVEKTSRLLEAGCKDLTVDSLRTSVDPFFEAMSELMGEQPRIPPLRLGQDSLRTLADQAKETLSDWSDLNIPDALGHLDFNPGNIICSADQCVFLDWSEAYVGPSFLTLEYIRFHLFKLMPGNHGLDCEVRDAYASVWRSVVTAAVVAKAQTLAPLLAVFAYAVTEQPWRDAEARRKDGLGAFLRSLTRRMHAEMQRLRTGKPHFGSNSCSGP